MTINSIEPTIGERIDIYLATQDLLKFPASSAIHNNAAKDIEWMRPALTVQMVAEGVQHARTKIATATLDDNGELTVKKWEMAL